MKRRGTTEICYEHQKSTSVSGARSLCRLVRASAFFLRSVLSETFMGTPESTLWGRPSWLIPLVVFSTSLPSRPLSVTLITFREIFDFGLVLVGERQCNSLSRFAILLRSISFSFIASSNCSSFDSCGSWYTSYNFRWIPLKGKCVLTYSSHLWKISRAFGQDVHHV